jgi:hypothetical protein
MVDAMKRITSDVDFRARARVAGPARAHLFDWPGASRRMVEVIEETAYR